MAHAGNQHRGGDHLGRWAWADCIRIGRGCRAPTPCSSTAVPPDAEAGPIALKRAGLRGLGGGAHRRDDCPPLDWGRLTLLGDHCDRIVLDTPSERGGGTGRP